MKNELQASKKLKKTNMLMLIIRIVQGAVVGLGGILPGISGGILCVIFGIYKPIMECLANPAKNLKKYASVIFPVLIGVVIGFFGLASIVNLLLEKNANLVVSAFAGLIFGMLPSLFKEAGKEGRTKGSYFAFLITFVLMFTSLLLISRSHLSIIPNAWWFVFCGIVWGISIIVPGANSSSILMFLGLYKPMTQGISDLEPNIIMPIIIGSLITVFAFAKLVNILFEKKYSVTYHIILGAVLSTTVLIIPTHFSSSLEIILAIGCIFAGFLTAFFLDKLTQKYKE